MKRLLVTFFISLVLSAAFASLKDGYVIINDLTGFTVTSFVGFVLFGIITARGIIKNREKIKPA